MNIHVSDEDKNSLLNVVHTPSAKIIEKRKRNVTNVSNNNVLNMEGQGSGPVNILFKIE